MFTPQRTIEQRGDPHREGTLLAGGLHLVLLQPRHKLRQRCLRCLGCSLQPCSHPIPSTSRMIGQKQACQGNSPKMGCNQTCRRIYSMRTSSSCGIHQALSHILLGGCHCWLSTHMNHVMMQTVSSHRACVYVPGGVHTQGRLRFTWASCEQKSQGSQVHARIACRKQGCRRQWPGSQALRCLHENLPHGLCILTLPAPWQAHSAPERWQPLAQPLLRFKPGWTGACC